MQDAFAVRRLDSAGDFESQLEGVIHTQGTRYRPSIDVLHHQVARTDIEDLADVGVIQRRDQARLLLKAGFMTVLELLDRDDPFEARIAGSVDFAHAARADGITDFVRAEFVAGR